MKIIKAFGGITAAITIISITGGYEAESSVDKTLFRVEEGKISQDFFNKIIAEVGEDAASCASLELHEYCMRHAGTLDGLESRDWLIEYQNYLCRLYQQAYEKRLANLPCAERDDFIAAEKAWRKYSVQLHPDPQIYNDYDRHIINIRTRTAYLEASDSCRRAADAINRQSVRCGGVPDMPIRYHYLERTTPVDLDKDDGEFYVERIAVVPPDFCREAQIGDDIYQIAILLPTNEISGETSTIGVERNLCVWKNGEFHAVYQLPVYCRVTGIKIHDNEVTVSFIQRSDDEYFCGTEDLRQRKPQTMTLDFTLGTYYPVKITNHLNYYQDGLGNLHTPGCCSGKYNNQF